MSDDRHTLRIANEEIRECQHCGDAFRKDPRNTWAQFRRQKFCSQACGGAAKTEAAKRARPPMAEVFNKWFERADGCWEWKGGRDKSGYGAFNYGGKCRRAHVVALELDGRPVPAGQYGCHTCDNPACVRPDHLYPGTPTQNMADASQRQRTYHGERHHWAKLDAEAVRHIRSSDLTDEDLASLYGVSQGAVTLARSGKTWKHVHG